MPAPPKQHPDGRRREDAPSRVDDLPALVEEQMGRRFTGPLRRRGWLWRGRPLDLFALIVMVLGVETNLLLLAAAGRLTPRLVLTVTAPVLLIALLVAVIALCRPEALDGRRPPAGRRGRKS
jgi:hypothetical protein